MCKWTLQEARICNKKWVQQARFSHKKNLYSDFLLTLLRKKWCFSSSFEDADILKSTPNKLTKYWRPQMRKKLLFFLLSQGIVRFQEFIVGKRDLLPYFVL